MQARHPRPLEVSAIRTGNAARTIPFGVRRPPSADRDDRFLSNDKEMPARRPVHHYSVYVVELSAAVWNVSRFRRANPGYVPGKPLVYVGMTGLDPDVRFDKHKAGIQSNGFVREFGLRLLPELYEVFNPMPYEGAREMEVELAIGLREAGYGVWQG